MSTKTRLAEKSFSELRAIYESMTGLRVPFATRKQNLIFFLENLHHSKKHHHRPSVDKLPCASASRTSRGSSKQQKQLLVCERGRPMVFIQPHIIATPTPPMRRLAGKCVKGRCDCSLACDSVLSTAAKPPIFNIYIGGRGSGDVVPQKGTVTSSTRYDQEVVSRKRTREEDIGRSQPEQMVVRRGTSREIVGREREPEEPPIS